MGVHRALDILTDNDDTTNFALTQGSVKLELVIWRKGNNNIYAWGCDLENFRGEGILGLKFLRLQPIHHKSPILREFEQLISNLRFFLLLFVSGFQITLS